VKGLALFVALCLAVFGYWFLHRPLTYPAGVLIEAEPLQIAETGIAPIECHGFNLKPLARFTLEARVLHRKVYRYDQQAAFAPVDVALGWGPMSDQSVLDRLSISQSMRFYWFEYHLPPPIAPDQIVSHSTNVHLIPATEQIASLCKSLRTGSLVHLGGELVEATGPGIGTWRISLSRTDTGNGACELMWVKEVTVLDGPGAADPQAIARR
jgi:hypothetical protein